MNMFTTLMVLALAAPAGGAAAPDLGALLLLADSNNPGIAAARSRLLADATIPSQLETMPDPVADISYTNVGYREPTLGDDGDAMLTVSWTQEVPYPGKLQLAGEASRRGLEMSRQRLEQIRLDIAARVKMAYGELYHSDRVSQILRENRELLASFLQTARVRYETGEGLLQNVLKAQTEIVRLDAELEDFAEERRVAEARLAALTGQTTPSPLAPALDLPGMTETIDTASLESDALARSPQILESEAAIQREETLHDLARRQLKPDLIWGAAYTNRGDIDPAFTGSFGMRLPLFRERKQTQMIAMTAHQVDAAKQDLAGKRLSIASEVRELSARVIRTTSLEKFYQEAILPQARSSLDSAAAAYGVGRVDFLTLLSDFTALLGYERDYVTQHHERFLALAGLERLTARTLIDTGSDTRTPREVAP